MAGRCTSSTTRKTPTARRSKRCGRSHARSASMTSPSSSSRSPRHWTMNARSLPRKARCSPISAAAERGSAVAMEVEEAKIALSDTRQADIPLEWVAPGLNDAIGRPDLVSHTGQLAERIAARIKICLAHARLSAHDIDAVFLTGGSVRLAHVRKAITKAVPSARIVEGDTFGAVGKGLTLEALRRYGPRD